MSESVVLGEPLPAAAALAVAEEQFVARAVKMARDPNADLGKMREVFEQMDPADRLRVSDRVTDALQRRATRTGDFDTLERALPYLPGQGQMERKVLEAEAEQPQRLSIDAQTIQQAISRVIEDRQPTAAPALKAYATQAIADHEQQNGPIQLSPEVRIIAGKPPVHTMDEFRSMVQQVQERSAVPSDRITPEAAAEVRQSLQQQIAGAASMRDLMKLYGQDDVQQSIKALAPHPEQAKALQDTMDAAGTRLLGEERSRLGMDRPTLRQAVDDETLKPVLDLTRRGDNGAPTASIDPPSIADRYDVRERGDERFYYQRHDGKLAIRADEQRIQGVLRDTVTIGAMLDIAASRGWTEVQIRGDKDIARDTWIEATARGLLAEGYVPTRDDRQEAEQRKVTRDQERHQEPPRMDAPPPARMHVPRMGIGL